MKNFILFLSVGSALLLGAAEPVFQWDFNNWTQAGTRSPASGAAGKNAVLFGRESRNTGISGSSAAECGNKVRTQAAYFPLDWKDFTVELKFKLNDPVDKKEGNALFCYATHTWNRRRFLVKITPRGELEASFRITSDNGKKVERSFLVVSDPLKFAPGKFYTLRVTASGGEKLVIYLDGRPVAEKSGTLSLLDLKTPGKVEWHPVTAVGFDQRTPERIASPLNGVIDDVKLWNTVETPDLFSASGSSDSTHLVLDGKWSKPFFVLDHESGPAGNFVKADDKFVTHAGRAKARIVGDELVVDFRCPVPAGMTPAGGAAGWQGDSVEFFFRPDAAQPTYFHYATNADGVRYAARCPSPGVTDPQWSSRAKTKAVRSPEGFTAEIRIPLAECDIRKVVPGSVYSGNFTRGGKTAGGLSSWAPVGTSFHNPDAFAPLIVGSRMDYFQKKLESIRAEAKKAGINLAELEKNIKTHADDPAWFDRLENGFSALKMAFLKYALKDKRQLIFQPDVWSNRMEVSSFTKPLETIRLTLPQNTRYYFGFAVANLTDKPYLGQIKCFPKWPYQSAGTRFFSEPWSDFCARISFFEAIESWNISGQSIYDALSPLPLNTVLRIAPYKTLPVWMEISTKGLKPGVHTGVVVLKDATGNPGFTTVKLEVDVRPVDLGPVRIDNFYYTYLQQSEAFDKPEMMRFFGRNEANYLFCIPGQLDIYPDQDADGKPVAFDFSPLDRMIDHAIASGIPKDQVKLILHLSLERSNGMRRPGKPPRFPADSPQWKRGMEETLVQWAQHLKKRYDMDPSRIVLYPVDEPNGDIDDPKSTLAKTLNWCKMLKKAVPELPIMVNPHPSKLNQLRQKAFEKLAPYCDIFELYRPDADDPKLRELMKKLGKTVWTYSILQQATHPSTYRRDFWLNMRDGFSPIATYWHLESQAGGDGFDPTDTSWGGKNRTDYGTVYADFNYGTILPSRRFIAHWQGREDRKLVDLCRGKLDAAQAAGRDVSASRAELQKLLAAGADADLDGMEQIRMKILKLTESMN